MIFIITQKTAIYIPCTYPIPCEDIRLSRCRQSFQARCLPFHRPRSSILDTYPSPPFCRYLIQLINSSTFSDAIPRYSSIFSHCLSSFAISTIVLSAHILLMTMSEMQEICFLLFLKQRALPVPHIRWHLSLNLPAMPPIKHCSPFVEELSVFFLSPVIAALSPSRRGDGLRR